MTERSEGGGEHTPHLGEHAAHLWLQRARLPQGYERRQELPPLLLPPVDAHRHLCGPYTAAGAIAQALVPVALERWPELVAAHDIEIRTVAPDLQDLVPARRRPIAERVPGAERILIHSRRRTLRIANGLAEFIRDHVSRSGHGTRSLVVENVHEADYADRELLGVLLRRLDPATLTLVVCADPARLHRLRPDPASAATDLAAVLSTHARAAAPPPEPAVRGDEEFARPHDERADELAAEGRIAPRLGAIPYHRERGGDRRLAIEALRYAMEWCFGAGCHDAVADLGLRGLRLVDPAGDPDGEDGWWRFLHRTASALSALGREEEAKALFDRVRRESADPAKHAAAAYSTAMLAIRHHDPARRDLDAALTWINRAAAISALLPDPAQRAFRLGFDLNGRALIEMRRGGPAEALRLVEEAIELARRHLEPGRHPVHRLVLRANRAQLKIMLGRLDEALGDLDAVIAADPHYPDYYLDRGNLLYRLGRPDAAVADYEAAMRVGPPFPEPYYNRAEIRFAAGDHGGALADLDHALELDPGFADAYVNRAGLLAAMGEYARARADAEHGLSLSPRNPYLLCVLGQVEMADERPAGARRAFDAALEADPSLAAAWANRGILAFENGDPEAAVSDLTRALELGEEAPLLFNRAVALRAAGREEEAVADLTRALQLAPDDDEVRHALSKR